MTPTAPEGRRAARGRPVVLLGTIAGVAVVIGGVAYGFNSLTYRSPVGVEVAAPDGTARVDGQTLQHVTLQFNTYPDSTGTENGKPIHPSGNSGWPAYGPTNQFQVPPHALVTVTVHQYDSGGSLNDPWFATVRGTVGNVETLDGKTVHSINPNNVGHTFTVRGTPGTDPNFFLNVPLEAVGGDNQTDTGEHHTIVFSFISGSKGIYAWNCEFPCGSMIASFGGVMGSYGFMSGFINVD